MSPCCRWNSGIDGRTVKSLTLSLLMKQRWCFSQKVCKPILRQPKKMHFFYDYLEYRRIFYDTTHLFDCLAKPSDFTVEILWTKQLPWFANILKEQDDRHYNTINSNIIGYKYCKKNCNSVIPTYIMSVHVSWVNLHWSNISFSIKIPNKCNNSQQIALSSYATFWCAYHTQ